MVQFCNQLDAMHSMKEQLEQRTKMIEANIQRQQDELRQIQDELQRVQGHSLQVVLETIRSRSAVLLSVLKYRVWILFYSPFPRRVGGILAIFQMFLQKGAAGLNLSSIQMAPANAVQQGATFNMQGQLVSPGPLQGAIQQQHAVQPQSQQQTLLRDQSSALAQVGRAPLFTLPPIPSWRH